MDTAELAERLRGRLQAAGLVTEPAGAEQERLLQGGTPLVQERIGVLSEAVDMLAFLFVDDLQVDPAAAEKMLTAEQQPVLKAAYDALSELGEWTTESVEAALRAALVDGLGLKPRHAFGPIRVAVTGRTVSPPLFESMELLGRERSLERLRSALR